MNRDQTAKVPWDSIIRWFSIRHTSFIKTKVLLVVT